jgi:hypothetical protein
MELMQNSLRLLHKIEEERGFGPSRLVELGEIGKKTVCLFLADARWLHAPPLLSLYTTAIRVGAEYRTDEPWEAFFASLIAAKKQSAVGGYDTSYLEQSKKGIPLLVRRPLEQLFAANPKDNYAPTVTTGHMHSSSGIVAYSNGRFPDTFPWPKPDDLLKQMEEKKE